jgi:hypothetical protein
MSLHAGTHLGPYEIEAPLGAGGWVRSTKRATSAQQAPGLSSHVTLEAVTKTSRREFLGQLGAAAVVLPHAHTGGAQTSVAQSYDLLIAGGRVSGSAPWNLVRPRT